jgi:hypothetical protein
LWILSPKNHQIYLNIFGVLVKLRVANIAPEFLSVCSSISPHLTPRLQVYGFLGKSIHDYFPKSVEKFQDSLTSGKNNDYYTFKKYALLTASRSMSLRMGDLSGKPL